MDGFGRIGGTVMCTRFRGNNRAAPSYSHGTAFSTRGHGGRLEGELPWTDSLGWWQ